MTVTNNKENKSINEDKKLSIAVLASFVILPFQYLILFYFNIFETSLGNIVQVFSKVVVGILFLFSFGILFRRKLAATIITYLVALVVVLGNILLFEGNRIFITEILFPLFFICLPSFLYSLSIKDSEIFREYLKKSSGIVLVIGIVIGIMQLIGRINIGSYSMSLGYYMLLPAINYLNEFLERFSIKSILFFSVSIMIIFLFGSRGPVLSILIYFFFYCVIFLKYEKLSYKKIFIVFTISAIIVFGLIFFDDLLLALSLVLERFNISSRNIRLFMQNGINLSGREEIYSSIINEIVSNPILGIGLAGDRKVSVYSHNIFLEILSGFGIIFGAFILISIFVIIVKVLFFRNKEVSKDGLVWFCIGFVHMLISSSYLIDFRFWIFLGVAVRSLYSSKKLIQKT